MPVLKNTAPVAGSVVMAVDGSKNVGVTEVTGTPVTLNPPALVGSRVDTMPFCDTSAMSAVPARYWRPGGSVPFTLNAVGSKFPDRGSGTTTLMRTISPMVTFGGVALASDVATMLAVIAG